MSRGCRGSLRLAAQDVALSRRKQGFESPRERQQNKWVSNDDPQAVEYPSNKHLRTPAHFSRLKQQLRIR
jgi:hypothetical protein